VTRLSIIIVSFNARRDLVTCLKSLTDAPPVIEHQIIVVDNASSDGSGDAARGFPSVRTIVLDRNVGFAAANNTGIRASDGELVLLLNSDTVAPAGAIDRLIERLHAVPAARVAGPRLVDGDGRPEVSFGRMISPFNELRQKVLGHTGMLARLTSREQLVDWVSGACLLVYRADAEAVGLLDERFFMYTEDVDFCAAIRARGRRILFTPDVEVVHLRGRSAATVPDATREHYRRSQVAFYEKHHPLWVPLLKLYVRIFS
jgi:GT2 family glycosyltransferase